MADEKYSLEEAREQIKTLEAFKDLVEGVPAVVFVDADDDLSTPIYISPQVEKLLGYTQEEWMNDPDLWTNTVHPDDCGWVFDQALKHTAEHGPFKAEYRMLAKDGHTVWVRDESVVVRDADGQVMYWRGMFVDVTEVKETEERLKRSLDMLRHAMSERRMLLRRVEDAGEQERRRIAGDIHDDSIQVMASVSLRLQSLHSDIPENRQPALYDIREMVDQAIDRLRSLVFELRPPALDSKGLTVALRQYLERAGAEAGFDYRIEDKLEVEPSPEVRTQLYRIAQEAIANIRKHANARLVEVSVHPKGSGAVMRIHDDGRGFDVGSVEPMPGHLGFSAMRERAEMAGGMWEIESSPGKGTTVEFWLPFEAPAPSGSSQN
jgi:PAS domain S-box-containing protein